MLAGEATRSQKGNQIRRTAFLGSKIRSPERNSTPNRVVFSGMDRGLFGLSDRTFFVFIFAFLSGARFATTPKAACIYLRLYHGDVWGGPPRIPGLVSGVATVGEQGQVYFHQQGVIPA